MKAIILIAHGSKKSSSNNEFLSMVENIEEHSNYDFTKAAFLELADPNIQEVTEELVSKQVKKIYFYPFFLNSGKHVLIDIPNIIDSFKEEYKEVDFTLLNHFGKSEKIHEIILNDIA